MCEMKRYLHHDFLFYYYIQGKDEKLHRKK